MLRMRRCRSIRFLIYLFILISISYLIVNYDAISFKLPIFQSRAPQPPPPPAKHQSRPTYEYNTLYRLKANRTLETTLNNQLLTLEHSIRSSLPTNERNLIANRTIWQIASPEEAETWSPWVAQWRDNNKEWAYKLHTTTPTEFLALFSSIPTITAAYETYPALRADLLRYLILWYHGGFYANIDTWARIGMRDCSPITSVVQGGRNISLMIGVEVDEPYLSPETTAQWGWTRTFGFGQFVMWAPKRFDPMIRRAIVRAISHVMVLENMQDRSWIGRLRETEVHMGEVTGASMFTDVVLEVLSESLREDHPLRDRDAGLERRVTWKWFRKLRMPLWIDPKEAKEGAEEEMRGLAVLPINRWSNGQRHSGAGNFEVEDACVNHVYGRIPWKKTWWEKLFG